MNRKTNRSIRRALLLAGFAALLAAGCSKKVTSVSESYTSPEGTESPNSRLVVFPDYPIARTYIADFSPPGPSETDRVDSVVILRKGSPTTMNGMIFDGTAAGGFQVFRREQGGGMRLLSDFVIEPSHRWLDSQWEFYSFRDDDPTRLAPPTYRARGLLSGAATERSPLTNLATSSDTALADIGLRILHGSPPFEAYTDSLFTLAWNAVPGAVGYYLHVFQFRNDLRDELERTLAGVPAPFFEGKSKDLYAAFFPPTVTQHKLGGGGGTLFTRRQTFFGQIYYARVSAVDAEGRMIATSRLGDDRIGPYEEGYTLQPLSAIAVVTSRVPPLEPTRAFPHALGARSVQVVESGATRILHYER